jgi:hypothetical protein
VAASIASVRDSRGRSVLTVCLTVRSDPVAPPTIIDGPKRPPAIVRIERQSGYRHAAFGEISAVIF